MTLYATNTCPERADTDATHRAVLNWLDQHPDLPVKYTAGNQCWPTPAATDDWHVLIETGGNSQLHISGAGPRYGSPQPTVIREPVPMSGRLATFGDGLIFDQILTNAVHNALAAVTHARRAATRRHRKRGTT